MNRIGVLLSVYVALWSICSGDAPAADPAPADAERIASWEEWLPESPRGVGPTIEDRRAWQSLAEIESFKGIVKRAERLSAEPVPELPDELYLDFSRTGNRTRYQGANDRRQGRINILALAECIENRGRFLPALEESVRAVCGQKTWVLPAHDRGLKNFKGTKIDIDLGASNTAWNMALVRYWLGDKLGAETRLLIADELERRIFAPHASSIRSGKPFHWWLNATNNWNAVCLAGATGAALAAVESRPRRAFFAAMAEKYAENFLKGFTPDGYCSEGLAYWNYGFGHYAMLAETLFQASGGKADLLDRPDVRRIALFGRRMEILPGLFPAFADCPVTMIPEPPLTALLNRRYGWGMKDAEASGRAQIGTQPYAVALYGFAAAPDDGAAKPAAAPQTPPRDWFPDAGVLICRPAPEAERALGAALKGGHNAEHHNHNDVGSFVVALGRSTPLLDPGSEIYTARTFSLRRYDSKVLNSLGHPVPRVSGKLQSLGRQAAAKTLKTEFSDRADTYVIDLTSAYDVKELKRLIRTFVFSREGNGKLTVADRVEFDGPQTFETALITFNEWEQLAPGRLRVGQKPDQVDVEITVNGAGFRLTAEKIEEQLPGGRTPTRIGIELTGPVAQAAVELTITPSPQ